MEPNVNVPGNGRTEQERGAAPGQEPAAPLPASETLSAEELRNRRRLVIGAVAVAIIGLLALFFVVYVLVQPSTDTAKVRDVFIILMALESLIIGLSLIILVVQVARLVNLLQNEIKPILESTQRTVNNLQGTTVFLTENMVEPVMKLNESLAAVRSLLGTVGLFKGK